MTEEKTSAKRSAIVLETEIQTRVANLARSYKLSQGIVIEAMMDMLKDNPDFDALLKSKRENKLNSRTGKTAILKKLAKLSAEDLEKLAASLESEE